MCVHYELPVHGRTHVAGEMYDRQQCTEVEQNSVMTFGYVLRPNREIFMKSLDEILYFKGAELVDACETSN